MLQDLNVIFLYTRPVLFVLLLKRVHKKALCDTRFLFPLHQYNWVYLLHKDPQTLSHFKPILAGFPWLDERTSLHGQTIGMKF